jgi:hypothetical protein
MIKIGLETMTSGGYSGPYTWLSTHGMWWLSPEGHLGSYSLPYIWLSTHGMWWLSPESYPSFAE